MANAPDISESEIISAAEKVKSQAKDRAPATVTVTQAGVVVGAAAFGPAGGLVGATVGSGIGYMTDKGYFGSEEEPEVIEAEID